VIQVLEIENLCVDYGPIQALKGPSLQVAPQEIVCVLGANGAGKSTLIRAISGQVKIKSGGIKWDGSPLPLLSPARIVELGIIQCPEGRQLFNTLTVEENIRLGATRLHTPFHKLKDDLEFLTTLFPIIGRRWKQKAGTLSGGEQQMVAIARSVIARPRLLLLDEPALGLAPKLVRQLFKTLPQIMARGPALIIVEQNARVALDIAQRGYVLQLGQIVAEGEASTVAQYLDEHEGYLGSAMAPRST